MCHQDHSYWNMYGLMLLSSGTSRSKLAHINYAMIETGDVPQGVLPQWRHGHHVLVRGPRESNGSC